MVFRRERFGLLGPGVRVCVARVVFHAFDRFGGDLLSHVLGRSTIGAAALNGRVRDGIGCFARANAARPAKRTTGQGPVMLHETVFPLTLLGQASWSVFFRIGSSLSGD